MKSLTLTLAILLALPFLAYSEGVIGFNYARAVEDTSWGAHGSYEKGIVDIDGEIQSGDTYVGNVEVGITADVFGINARLYSSNNLKGYDLDTLGRQNDIGLDFVVPLTDEVDASVGVFGRNGNPFAPRNALGTLTDAGFAEDAFDGLGLGDIELNEGLSIKEGSTVNAAVKLKFDVSRFDIEAKGLFELGGEGEKVHQFITEIGTGGALTDGISWRVNATVASQLYGDIIEYEVTNFAGVEYSF